MSVVLSIMMGGLGLRFGRLGWSRGVVASNPGTPTGDGTMDFSNADDSGLIILLEDI